MMRRTPLIVLRHAEKQTVDFNIKARVEFKSKKRARMGIWEAMEMLNTLVDESDPDVRALLCISCATLIPFVIDGSIADRTPASNRRGHAS